MGREETRVWNETTSFTCEEGGGGRGGVPPSRVSKEGRPRVSALGGEDTEHKCEEDL